MPKIHSVLLNPHDVSYKHYPDISVSDAVLLSFPLSFPSPPNSHDYDISHAPGKQATLILELYKLASAYQIIT